MAGTGQRDCRQRGLPITLLELLPGPGLAAYPRIVVVPGQNSEQAKVVAMQRFPGFLPGLVAKADRNRNRR